MGVPLIEIILEAQVAITPAGRPIAVPIPVAPIVVCVIAVKDELIHTVGVEDGALTILSGRTMITPTALSRPQPPESGIE